MPKNGILWPRANSIARIIPSMPRLPNPPGTRMRVDLEELAGIARPFESLRVDEDQIGLDAVGEPTVDQRLVERLVGVGEIDVLADDADRDLAR